MKLACVCGELIVDVTDKVAQKAHIIPDQAWFDVLAAIDDAIENNGDTHQKRESACMGVRKLMQVQSRSAWQCEQCGRLYIDDAKGQLQTFVPANDHTSRRILQEY